MEVTGLLYRSRIFGIHLKADREGLAASLNLMAKRKIRYCVGDRKEVICLMTKQFQLTWS
jgi:hypothetical protein